MEHRVPKLPEISGTTPSRRPRLSLDETRRRVLSVAVDQVLRDGMASGLEHVRIEDAVRAANVSRTAAYRCWPQREDFLVDLLAELAAHALPVEGDRGPRATAVIREAIGDDPAVLRTVEGRRDALRRVVRASAEDDLAADGDEQRRWQLYLALALAVPTVPAGPGRERVATAVAEAENAVLDRLERSYRLLLELFGFAPRIEYRELARIGVALMRGSVIGEIAGETTGGAVGTAFEIMIDGAVVASDSSDWEDDRARLVLDRLAAHDAFDAD